VENLRVDLSSTNFVKPDHVVFVWFENKDYSQIVSGSDAPFMQSLINHGTLFTNMHALFHPSRGNYIAFFAGDNFGITKDDCIKGSPNSALNLYTILDSVGISCTWYSEGLPGNGYKGCSDSLYVQKHNPTTIFSNVPKSASKPLSSLNLSSGFNNWPQVICVTPNLNNDMHNGTIAQGDAWLKNNFSKYINWSLAHNSMLVVYFDENDGTKDRNLIPVIAVGANVRNNYKNNTYYDHYNWTKTIAKWYGADSDWNDNLKKRRAIVL
jgi:acid phosphatase